jgi:hypothetical protein
MKVVVNDNRFAAQRDCISHCHECGILRVHVDESTLYWKSKISVGMTFCVVEGGSATFNRPTADNNNHSTRC